MSQRLFDHLHAEIDTLKNTGLYKAERALTTPQRVHIDAKTGSETHALMNFCANNYLGLADDQSLIDAAKTALDQHGYGMASVRFICGTNTLHQNLEGKISDWLQQEDTILYSSCFDANAGLFETLLGPDDAIISDALNHASIIDGVRLCKAKRFRYQNNDMADLEAKLIEAKSARYRLIATDGVFSMDGVIANLPDIVDLAKKYDALLMVDDSHASGLLGENGRGSIEYHNVLDHVDIVTSTLGKALGGASGGFTSGKAVLVDWLRQRSRPYLFSNSLAPTIAHTTLTALDIVASDRGQKLRRQLHENSAYFREKMTALGFTLAGSDHPIIPVMIGEATLAGEMAAKLQARGLFVTSFSYPVVPKGAARIRTQMSAAFTRDDLDRAINAFAEVGREIGVLK